jgi:phasin family protein
MLTQEQVAETRKANLDLLFDLSIKTVEGVEKLAALYMQTIRATLADTVDLAQKSLSVKEPQDWLALQNSLAASMADKVQIYSRQAIDIISATQAEFTRIGKAQCEAYGRQMKSVVEDVARNAPAGSEATMTALDSAIAAANTLYETLQSSGQQAVEATRSNLEIAAAASKSARRAIDPVSQAAKR